MVEKLYRFQIRGTGRGDKTWQTDGEVMCEFHDAFDAAMQETFQALTLGNAIYGESGVGCDGPYQIERVVIERVPPQ